MEEKTIPLAELSNYCLVSKKGLEKIKEGIRELSQERNMWKEKYEELKILHSALDSAYDAVACQCHGYKKVVDAHNINPDEVVAAMNAYRRAKKRAEAVVEKPYLDPDEEREFYEDDYPGWGSTFEQAAQKSSREEWEEGAKKAEEQ